MRLDLLVTLLVSCLTQKAPSSSPPSPPASTPVTTAPANVCRPLTGTPTDPAEAVACEGCRQKYFSGMGLPDGMTFDACVAEHVVSVRAKLAVDPHHFDAVARPRRRR